ncbi:TorD/DmsD family molecular chaperone [Adlercreutzia muris]|uniref:TorD/DmsD family molecular chaperone n=1 Tax=Adlercreutzia muris TaxID=1796610 RepID=UPI001F567C0F|nr:molecular chaperone TorD family protein [Adlercreutzia muris]
MDETMTDNEMRELMEERAAIYEFLSIAFGEELPLAFLRELSAGPVALEGPLGSFAASLGDADEAALEAVRTNLAAEYARLFLGMSRHPVAPYESVYTSPAGLLMQEARDEVLAVYRAEGFAVDGEAHLPEDHAAFEFGFMAGLARKTVAALACGEGGEADRLLDVQGSFVADHLSRWIPSLADDVEARATMDFYRGLAELARSFTACEAEALAPERGAGAGTVVLGTGAVGASAASELGAR